MIVVSVPCCDDDGMEGCVNVEGGTDEDGEGVDDVVDKGMDEEEVDVGELVLGTLLLLDCDDEAGCDVLRRGDERVRKSMKQRWQISPRRSGRTGRCGAAGRSR